jgi:hypothetical protein
LVLLSPVFLWPRQSLNAKYQGLSAVMFPKCSSPINTEEILSSIYIED